ncbi:hypothetical protein ACI784_09270 [Geodermatophilus sp. SYSU D01186]
MSDAFDVFLGWLIPLETHRQAAARHRTSVEASLKAALTVQGFYQPGSFWHGTGVRYHCDVDLLVKIGNPKPGSSDTALGWVKDALTDTFPRTPVYVSRPAVVVDFANGTERWEVIPGFKKTKAGSSADLYDIPGAGTGWIDTAPAEHVKYVNEVNDTRAIGGGAKSLARLAKAWKYYNDVPISSFYLEMRAAEHMKAQSNFIPGWDLCLYLEGLEDHSLAAMSDPKHVAGRFYPCSSEAKKAEALSKLHAAAVRARKAHEANSDGKPDEAFRYLNLLFNGNFPAR